MAMPTVPIGHFSPARFAESVWTRQRRLARLGSKTPGNLLYECITPETTPEDMRRFREPGSACQPEDAPSSRRRPSSSPSRTRYEALGMARLVMTTIRAATPPTSPTWQASISAIGW